MTGETEAVQDAVARLTAALLEAQAPDGGWGMHAGKPPATEATAFAALALAAAARRPAQATASAAVAGGVGWLARHQRADGGWPATGQVADSSWPTAPAVLALAKLPGGAPAVERGTGWLLVREGDHASWVQALRFRLFASAEERRISELDRTIAGWPWMTGTFSWVEPTALAVLALRAATRLVRGRGRDIAERVEDGERLLVDRAVPGGGWNYGNRRVFEADLEAYPDTTAWALLALRGSARGRAAVAAGLGRMVEQMRTNRSPLARALAVLALHAHARDASPLAAALAAQCGPGSADPAPTDARARALSLLALTAPGALLPG